MNDYKGAEPIKSYEITLWLKHKDGEYVLPLYERIFLFIKKLWYNKYNSKKV